MDVLDIVRTLLRRWMVVVPILVLTAVAAYLLSSRAPEQYTATGQMLVVDAQTGGDPDPTDAAVLGELVQSDEVRRAVAEQVGGPAFYEVDTSREGILEIEAVTTDDPARAVRTVQGVLDALGPTLGAWRPADSLPPGYEERVEVLNIPSEAIAETQRDGSQEFTARGSARLVLTSPEREGDELDDETARRLLAATIERGEVGERIRDAFGVTIGVDTNDDGESPVVEVTATGGDPQVAQEAVEALMEAAPDAVNELDALPTIAVDQVTQPFMDVSAADIENRGRLRLVVAVAALGVGAAVALAILVEAVAQARANRRAYAPSSSSATGGYGSGSSTRVRGNRETHRERGTREAPDRQDTAERPLVDTRAAGGRGDGADARGADPAAVRAPARAPGGARGGAPSGARGTTRGDG